MAVLWQLHRIFPTLSRYIQAATSPKNIVILVDASGSMKGLRKKIAKATVLKILNTLSDDDFFNVLKFAEKPEYVDECFNGTLVQANADNKKRFQEGINNIKPKNIAYIDLALKEAFELLDPKGRRLPKKCNRAIMLITDGAPESYEAIFEAYNWPNITVRVFTYLIGREVGEARQVKWMACANKGYYSHISTLADVQEHVQDYIHVLSRPMVIKRAPHTVWTTVYYDAAHDHKGLRMMTSVAQPVFDKSNDTKEKGILLGVMGTDVPVKELIKLTPQYKLGVNGYAFALTNNGYILFHPDFRPTKGNVTKPNYNSVDLAEVELPVVEGKQDLYNVPLPDFDMQLRRKMVDRKTGNLTMEVKVHYDDMKRVTIRENNYFFTAIAETPFSLGIALPSGYGMHWLDGTMKLKDIDLSIFKATPVKIAPWNYCKMDTNETRQDRLEMLLKYLKYGEARDTKYDQCDEDLVESILFDADATRFALINWMKANRDGTHTHILSKRNGVELVFVGTKGGLTRYAILDQNLTDPNFIDEHTGTIEELYYKRAVETGEDIFTFSVPFNAGKIQNETVVTGSSPIIITIDGRSAVAAVVGLQMKYQSFHDFFMNSTKMCPDENCNITCKSEELDCFLLDNNGFVVLSENRDEVGMFFGEIDATLMKELIIDEKDTRFGGSPPAGVFQRVEMFDYQAICEIWEPPSSRGNSIFIDPLRKMFSTLSWLVRELALFLVEFNLYSWWHGESTHVRGQPEPNPEETGELDSMLEPESDIHVEREELSEDDKLFQEVILKLSEFGTRDQVLQWKSTLTARPDFTAANREKIMQYIKDLRKQMTPVLVGRNSCVRQVGLFNAELEELAKSGTITNCGGYRRSYSAHRVPKTNLILLAVDAQCYCIDAAPIKMEPQEIQYNETMMCQRLQEDVYRRPPAECHDTHEDEDYKNFSLCGAKCALIRPSLILLSLLLTIYFEACH